MRQGPPCCAVIAITRAYNGDLVPGMLASGAMTPDDFARSIAGALRMVPTGVLIEELSRRNAA